MSHELRMWQARLRERMIDAAGRLRSQGRYDESSVVVLRWCLWAAAQWRTVPLDELWYDEENEEQRGE